MALVKGILTATQTISGSVLYNGITALATGSISAPTSSVLINSLTYVSGYNNINLPQYTTISTPFIIPAGTHLELWISAVTLGTGSAPLLLHG
jgi:hypothetical protein